MIDGEQLLFTNFTDLTPKHVAARYKRLADIERGFRVLKSEIEIATVYHPPRVRIVAAPIEIDNSGAEMRRRSGTVRTSIQGQGGGEAVAPGERTGG